VSYAGDVNGDGLVDVLDVFFLINYLFAGGSPPLHPTGVTGDAVYYASGDVNHDGNVDVLDVFYLINALFAAGPAPH